LVTFVHLASTSISDGTATALHGSRIVFYGQDPATQPTNRPAAFGQAHQRPLRGDQFQLHGAALVTDVTVERRLALLLASTGRVREARAGEIAGLAARADAHLLIDLMDRLQVSVLLGSCLREAVAGLDPWLDEQIAMRTFAARRNGEAQEMVALGILASLSRVGIRALGLKGVVLARQLYGGAGARTSADIDILVSAADLAHAVEVVRRMGWQRKDPVPAGSGLPVLHEEMVHPELPMIELHWRVHWYETQFAADLLARAESPAPHQPLVMDPADGLAALTLFYARDGFSGLKMATDVASWWDSRCEAPDADAVIGAIAATYPELAGALWVATGVLGSLVGLPTTFAGGPLRWQIAAELASPFTEPTAGHLGAIASLVDLLVTPRAGRVDSLRREVQKVPKGLERPLTPDDGLFAYLARSEHVLRVTRCWGMALASATGRAYRQGANPRPASIGR
jgi:Uncharacterised nucleotidyltransferase